MGDDSCGRCMIGEYLIETIFLEFCTKGKVTQDVLSFPLPNKRDLQLMVLMIANSQSFKDPKIAAYTILFNLVPENYELPEHSRPWAMRIV